MSSRTKHGPSVPVVAGQGKPVPPGFARISGDAAPRIAPLPKAAALFGMTRKRLYSILFSPIHVTPEGIVWKFRGRHMVDLEKCERWIRGGDDAK